MMFRIMQGGSKIIFQRDLSGAHIFLLSLETLWGQVPMLYVDDQPLAQTGAINRYLAGTFGLMGDSSFSAATCDMVYETLQEVFSKLPFNEKDMKKKV